MPDVVWRRLVTLDGQHYDKPKVRQPPAVQSGARSKLTSSDGWPRTRRSSSSRSLPREGREHPETCGEDHGGILDVLLERTDEHGSFVVLELKGR